MRIITLLLKASLVFLVAFIIGFRAAQAQSLTKSTPKQILWSYDLPSYYPEGPLDILVKGEYWFTKFSQGNKYFVQLHSNIRSIEFFTEMNGTLRYKYKGKEYRQDQVNAADGLGNSGFDAVKISSIVASVDVHYLENSKTGNIGEDIIYIVGEIDKDGDLDKLSIEWAGSRLKQVNWEGASALQTRLANLNKPKSTSKQTPLASGSSPSETSDKGQVSSATNGSKENSTTTRNNDSDHSKTTKDVRGQNVVKNSDKPDLIQTPEGKYYKKDAQGNFQEISRSDYNTLKGNTATENKPASRTWTRQQTDSLLAATEESRGQKIDKITRESQQMQKSMESGFQSFYAAQAAAAAKANMMKSASLDGEYGSVAEILADFQTKYQDIATYASQYLEERNNVLNAGYDALLSNADATSQAAGQLAVGIGSLINEANAEKKAKEARENLKLARDKKLREMEIARKERQLALRNNFLSKFKEGGLPLASHRLAGNEVYFLAYAIDKSKLTEEKPAISVVTVFPVGKYGDGTWPYKNNILQDLKKVTGKSQVTIVGYFTNRDTAEALNNAFLSMADKCNLAITTNNYKGKAYTASTPQQFDNWGNKKAPSASTGNDARVDFWGNPVKDTTRTGEKPNSGHETKLDYWGNPGK